MIHDYLKVTYPEKQLEIINKGIGGNRVIDLAERWEDVIAQEPDVVSISIGINDVWPGAYGDWGSQKYMI